jgi:hypothetical protein
LDSRLVRWPLEFYRSARRSKNGGNPAMAGVKSNRKGGWLDMTIDERLDRLTERHEALAQSLELLHASTQDLRESVMAHDRYVATLMSAARNGHQSRAAAHAARRPDSGLEFWARHRRNNRRDRHPHNHPCVPGLFSSSQEHYQTRGCRPSVFDKSVSSQSQGTLDSPFNDHHRVTTSL